jgi:putative nucleic acid binding protein
VNPEVLVNADALWKDYFANPFSADKKYLDRQFAVELRPFQIARLPNGNPTVVYKAWGTQRIRALFLESETEKITQLVKEIDSAIVIHGTCEGLEDGYVRMSQCTLIDPANVIDAK